MKGGEQIGPAGAVRRHDSARPTVTLIIPVRNEVMHVTVCLRSVRAQDYPADSLEILVVDGRSNDGTVGLIEAEREDDPRIRVLENPEQDLPHGLNIGIGEAGGSYVGYVHGRSVLPVDYVSRCVELLNERNAWSVGGRIVRVGDGSLERAIALATSSRVGVGDSRHNYAESPQWVETVFPGFWRRDLFDRIGLFDPDMVSNEDNELSHRIRKSGGRVWYDPAIEVKYFPRTTLRELFHQYRRYGVGKVRVLRKHRGGLRFRHVVPAAWLAFLVVGAAASTLAPAIAITWLAGIGAYALIIGVAAVRTSQPGVPWWMIAAALVTLHAGYGAGTCQGLATWFSAGSRSS